VQGAYEDGYPPQRDLASDEPLAQLRQHLLRLRRRPSTVDQPFGDDALTFETCSSGTGDLEPIGRIVTDKKVVVGVIDHHTLQIERPDQVADIVREALKHIPPERIVISSDCGMGREGMSRRHAQYKMVAMVLGTNIVRKEMGLPEAECLAADPRYSLAM
jgi:5-methyltetrahydropteroyltriglutamate--homocysteine methyltransferase